LQKQALDAYDSAIGFYRDQIHVHKQLQATNGTVDPRDLEDNFAYLKSKLAQMEESQKQLYDSLQLQSSYARLVEQELVALKPQLNQLRKQRARLVKYGNSLNNYAD
jgi:hypothetical protein